MRKFTVFTAILTVVVVVVVAEIVVNRYLPEVDGESGMELQLPDDLDLSKITQTSVLDSGLENRLGADVDYDAIPEDLKVERNTESDDAEEEELVYEELTLDTDDLDDGLLRIDLDGESDEAEGTVIQFSSGFEDDDDDLDDDAIATTDGIADFEDVGFSSYSPSAYLSEEQVRSAGFKDAYLEDQEDGGYLFKTIEVADLYDVDVKLSVVRTSDTYLAKVYVFKIGTEASASEVYNVLKLRMDEGTDTTINETNEFGSASFFMNDARRTGTAFLVVRIGDLIYAFSYPKDYHPQIKNLLKLIQWDIE